MSLTKFAVPVASIGGATLLTWFLYKHSTNVPDRVANVATPPPGTVNHPAAQQLIQQAQVTASAVSTSPPIAAASATAPSQAVQLQSQINSAFDILRNVVATTGSATSDAALDLNKAMVAATRVQQAPSGLVYVVGNGDSLVGIAKRLGLTTGILRQTQGKLPVAIKIAADEYRLAHGPTSSTMPGLAAGDRIVIPQTANDSGSASEAGGAIANMTEAERGGIGKMVV